MCRSRDIGEWLGREPVPPPLACFASVEPQGRGCFLPLKLTPTERTNTSLPQARNYPTPTQTSSHTPTTTPAGPPPPNQFQSSFSTFACRFHRLFCDPPPPLNPQPPPLQPLMVAIFPLTDSSINSREPYTRNTTISRGTAKVQPPPPLSFLTPSTRSHNGCFGFSFSLSPAPSR